MVHLAELSTKKMPPSKVALPPEPSDPAPQDRSKSRETNTSFWRHFTNESIMGATYCYLHISGSAVCTSTTFTLLSFRDPTDSMTRLFCSFAIATSMPPTATADLNFFLV